MNWYIFVEVQGKENTPIGATSLKHALELASYALKSCRMERMRLRDTFRPTNIYVYRSWEEDSCPCPEPTDKRILGVIGIPTFGNVVDDADLLL